MAHWSLSIVDNFQPGSVWWGSYKQEAHQILPLKIDVISRSSVPPTNYGSLNKKPQKRNKDNGNRQYLDILLTRKRKSSKGYEASSCSGEIYSKGDTKSDSVKTYIEIVEEDEFHPSRVYLGCLQTDSKIEGEWWSFNDDMGPKKKIKGGKLMLAWDGRPTYPPSQLVTNFEEAYKRAQKRLEEAGEKRARAQRKLREEKARGRGARGRGGRSRGGGRGRFPEQSNGEKEDETSKQSKEVPEEPLLPYYIDKSGLLIVHPHLLPPVNDEYLEYDGEEEEDGEPVEGQQSTSLFDFNMFGDEDEPTERLFIPQEGTQRHERDYDNNSDDLRPDEEEHDSWSEEDSHYHTTKPTTTQRNVDPRKIFNFVVEGDPDAPAAMVGRGRGRQRGPRPYETHMDICNPFQFPDLTGQATPISDLNFKDDYYFVR